ncbi:uncharacterized protein LOC108928733 isoform X2 [Scleropages formosus]|uniref:uncharacterized protein LOC108928733 isoform X2 n=1 Tax=Scleropages formosus TaxID=113540 RepID=UPI0008784B59|nr:uncharacterized protein LOC108928733 isoform X2 [Scleropages formosus]
MSPLERQVTSVVDTLIKAAVAEMRKVVRGAFAALSFKNEAQKTEVEGKFKVSFESSMPLLVSSVGIMVEEAVAKICEIISADSAVLRLEVTQSQNENEALRKKLDLMEKKLLTVQGGGEKPVRQRLPVALQSDHELRASERDGCSVECCHRTDLEPSNPEEVSQSQANVLMDKVSLTVCHL